MARMLGMYGQFWESSMYLFVSSMEIQFALLTNKG
jgi:hypothetical protein